MKNKILVCVLVAAAASVLSTVQVKAVDYNTALIEQQKATENYYAMLTQQQAAASAQQQSVINAQKQAAEAANAQQAAALKTLQDQQAAAAKALHEQQVAALKALQDQQAAAAKALHEQQAAALKALQDQQAAAAKAQQSALEAANAIQAASLITPQLDVICDTNCAEKNALIYSATAPDFVLVDISEQRVVFYRNGLRVLADNCVTGDAKKGYHTTVGVHQIIFKDLNRTLHGSYGEAFVRYWMRFTRSGQGLHDAGWRRNFGNSIYISNGSHGCVNLPRETAAVIYNNSYEGMYVIVEN